MSGVYIKGMQMPKGHPVCIVIDAAGQGLRYDLNNDRYADKELFETIPVPDHGRLGDLDKLIEKIDGIWDCNDMVFRPNDHCCNVPEDCKGCKWAETKNFIRRMIANAPTIIPADKEADND